MAYGQRQQRNEGDQLGGAEGSNPPTTWDTSSVMSSSQGTAAAYMAIGQQVWSGATGGDRVLGSTWDWDDGLAVPELPGEWSDPAVTANSSPNANTPSNVIGMGDGKGPEWL